MTDDDVDALTAALGLAPDDHRQLAERLGAVGGLVGLWRAGPQALAGLPKDAMQRWAAIVAVWRRLHAPRPVPTIDGPQALIACLDPFLPLMPVETFHAVLLDGRGRFLGAEEVARGTVDACLVHPREVFAPAVRARASAVAVVHNHPSGDPAPSAADLALTDRLGAAGRLLGIPLVDHVVVGRGAYRSLGDGVCDVVASEG